MDARPNPIRFCIDTLLPQGLCILGGAPKIGKSWLVLDLCVRVAKGEYVWGLKTHSGTVLYLCLEDSYNRLISRLSAITDEVTSNVFFAIQAENMENGLCDQIRAFCTEHKDATLVAIDTFQIIRSADTGNSYADDYREMRALKSLADELQITLLLVHHLCKQGDSDPLNKLSGTTGISGATDAIFILDRSNRGAGDATLNCTGRDIESREFELRFDKENCVWTMLSDSLERPEMLLPNALKNLVEFVKVINTFDGNNTEFTEQYNAFSCSEIAPKSLKQMMNRYRFQLENVGVFFENRRSNGQRFLKIYFSSAGTSSDASASSDASNGVCETCVPCDPCVTDENNGFPKFHRFSGWQVACPVRGKQSAWLSTAAPNDAGEPTPLTSYSDTSQERREAV